MKKIKLEDTIYNNFTISTNIQSDVVPTDTILRQYIDNLAFGKDKIDFIVLEKVREENNIMYLQSTIAPVNKTEIFYIMEAREAFGESFKHYRLKTTDKQEVIKVFRDYLNDIIPNFLLWTDVTNEF